MNNSRFKFFLIPKDNLKNEAYLLNEPITLIFKEYQLGNLFEAELVFLIIALFCEQRRPSQWWMKGADKNLSINATHSTLKLQKQSDTNSKGEGVESNIKNGASFYKLAALIKLPTQLKSLKCFYSYYRFKNLPEGVASSIYQWHFHRINLTLSHTPITPLEMLADQACGKRTVTAHIQSFLSGEYVDKRRDALEFLMHDLCHAHLYFSTTHDEQKIFFQKLFYFYNNKDSFLSPFNDSDFKNDLEYIMSDMNSNSIHLKETLRGKIVSAIKRNLLLQPDQKIPSHIENQIETELSLF